MAIELKEALQQLESGNWCLIRYIMADLKKAPAANWLSFPNAESQGGGLSKQRHIDHNVHFTEI